MSFFSGLVQLSSRLVWLFFFSLFYLFFCYSALVLIILLFDHDLDLLIVIGFALGARRLWFFLVLQDVSLILLHLANGNILEFLVLGNL